MAEEANRAEEPNRIEEPNRVEEAGGASSNGRYRVALGVSGGIAAYKAAEVLRGLQSARCEVRVCMTARAAEFIRPLTFRSLSGAHVVTDDYAPDNPDPIAHITFSQSVDLLLIAPATANIIAKFANGIADDFLTSTYLASTAPVALAPAMNTTMWEHPATRRNIARLRADGVHIIEPDAGQMACGTFGAGRLADPAQIVEAALRILGERVSPKQPSSAQLSSVQISGEQISGARTPQKPMSHEHTSSVVTPRKEDLQGESILITAGGTREAIDPVRFLSNRSSGRMGFALAEAAAARGASVTLIAGTASAHAPEDERISVLHVTTAAQMHAAVMERITQASVFIAAAAVADYRPAQTARDKIKKTGEPLILKLELTADILADVSLTRPRPELLLVGFAAESRDVIAHAGEKLARKNLDLIVANDITQDGAGFDVETNIVTLISSLTDVPLTLPLLTKRQAAERILDEVIRLRVERKKNAKRSTRAADAREAEELTEAAHREETFATETSHNSI